MTHSGRVNSLKCSSTLMVKQMIKFLRLILVMSLALFSVNAVAELKVGYVNVEKILKDAPQTAETGKKLEKEFSQRAAELTRLEKQIEKQISEQKNSDTAKGRELASLRIGRASCRERV